MPGSIRTIDATSQRYDPTDSLPSSPEKAPPTKRTSKLVAPMNMPPSPPADIDLPYVQKMGDMSPRSRSPAGLSSTSREGRRITRDITRGSPGDQAIFSNTKTPEQKTLAKRKSQYYNEVFANREPIASPRERVLKESPIVADLKTNVIVQDEFTLITELSSFLSIRFQRPESSIVVSVSHSVCMLHGGTFDPAYTLTITALGSLLQPVTNKRNAALLAKHIEEGMGVDPKRGVIKFTASTEDNLAVDGRTMTSEIDELEKITAENNLSLQGSLSRGEKKVRRQSLKSLRGAKPSQLPTHNESMVSLPSTYSHHPPLPPMPTEMSTLDKRAEKAQRIGRRKSFIATIFGKS